MDDQPAADSCGQTHLAVALAGAGLSPPPGLEEASVDSASTCASSDAGGDKVQSLGAEAPADEAGDPEAVDDAPLESSACAWRQRRLLVVALGEVLTHLASLGCRPQRATCFHAAAVPQLAISIYLERLAEYYHCSDQCLVLSLVYIDRIVKLHPEFVVSPLNVHRLLAVSMMSAAKFWDDVFYSNSHYAKVAGVRVKEICTLEAQFLKLIDWRLLVQADDYGLYHSQILMAVQGTCLADAS